MLKVIIGSKAAKEGGDGVMAFLFVIAVGDLAGSWCGCLSAGQLAISSRGDVVVGKEAIRVIDAFGIEIGVDSANRQF
jgi:hypothetical protein